MVFGNPQATHILTKVCNPFCGPCRRAHTKINELINQRDLKIQIIFSGIKENPDDRTNIIVGKFMAIYQQASPAIFHQALNDWYLGALTQPHFIERYQAFQPTEATAAAMDRMRSWTKQTDIQFTPTYFFDHHQLPESYEMQDLKAFI